MDLKRLKKKFPRLYLYYHDNNAWTLYIEKPPKNTYSGEPEHDRYVLGEGGGMDSGYVPDIVQILCDALGIKVDSA